MKRIAAAVALFFFAAPVSAQIGPDAMCSSPEDNAAPEQVLQACDMLIKAGGHGPERESYFLLYRGRAYAALGKLDLALKDYDRAEKIHPGHGPIAASQRARLYIATKDYEKALKEADIVVKGAAGHPDGYELRGHIYRVLGKLEPALKDLDTALGLRSSAEMLVERASVHGRMENYEKALEDYSAAIQRNPNYGTAYYGRAYVYRHLEQYENSVKDYDRYIELSPNDNLVYVFRGAAYLFWQRYQAAILDFDRVLKAYPEEPDAYFYRGSAYYEVQNYARAIADFGVAIRLRPKLALIHVSRGAAYLDSGDNARAIEDFTTAIKLKPDYAYAYKKRAEAQPDDRFDLQLADYASALKIDPEYQEVYLDRCFFRAVFKKEADLALADCNEAKRLDPEDGSVYATRAVYYYLAGDFEPALADCKTAIEKGETVMAHYVQGLIKLAQGNKKEGDDDIAKAKMFGSAEVERLVKWGVK